ncbi:MAG: substrate-binding domain-containing protein [Burkholderiaceae bacterium]
MTSIHILSGGAAAAVVRGVQADFERDLGARIEGTFSAVGQMRDRFLAGAECDLVILTRPIVTQLVASGHLVAGSERSLGLVRTGLAVRAGAPHPPVGDREQLAQALRAAREIYHPDPKLATAGIHFMKVLDELGIRESVAAALRPFPNGATAMGELARTSEAAAIGCTQETEINYTRGVELIGSLPAELGLTTDYTLAISSSTREPALVQELARRLSGPESEAVRREGGFDF